MAAKTDFIQIGASATDANNFVLQTDAAGGFKLARGVLTGGVPVTTQDILAVSSAGDISTSRAIEVTDATQGVILKSPNGTRWRVTASNAGALVLTSL